MKASYLKPLLPLRDIVIFPSMVIPLFVGREKSIKALQEVMKSDKSIILVTQKNSEVDDPTGQECWSYQGAARAELAALLTYLILAVLAARGFESCTLHMNVVTAVASILLLTCVLPCIIALFFPLPNNIFNVYGWLAVIGASISRLVQVVLYVDWAYDLNDWVFDCLIEL